MADNFFQERFLRNLKFYETTTVEELRQKYDLLYGDLNFKDVCLAELLIIKRLLNKEKLSKKGSSDVDFLGYINQVDELYSRIDGMSESEIQEKRENLEMIIVSIKLSLNSPVYFVIDVDKLREFDLDFELNSFIDDVKSSHDTNSVLKQFKEVLNHEIDKKKELIETKKKEMRNSDTLKQFEDLYWRLNSNQIDTFSFISEALKLDFTSDEKKTILDVTQKMIQFNDKKSVDIFNNKISLLVSNLKKANNLIIDDIVDIESSISLITKISQNISAEGLLIRGIDDNLIDEYISLISSLNLNVAPLTYQITKEQNRIVRKQRIEQIVKVVEDKIKSLSKKVQPEEQKVVTSTPAEYNGLLEAAKKVIDLANNSGINLELDELESIFVEELRNVQVDEKKIEDVLNSASSEACKFKFIVHGLNYQLANINQDDIKKSMNLIELYIRKYSDCFKKLSAERDVEQLFNKRVSEMKDKVIETESQIEEDILEQLDMDKIKYLDVYVKYDLDNMSDRDKKRVEYDLNQLGIDLITLKLYKSFVDLKKQISETKIFIDMIEEEKSMDFLPQAEEKIESISSLLKRYIDLRDIYLDAQKAKQNIGSVGINDGENILVYFENEDGTTEVEDRIISDYQKNGRYSQTDVNNIYEMIKRLRNSTPDDIISFSDDLNNIFDTTGYKVRKIRQGQLRLEFLRLNSSALKTDKPVYLVILVGKKVTDELEIYEYVGRLKESVLKYEKDLYELFDKVTPEQRQLFFERQQKIEANIMDVAQNGRGEKDATIRRQK